MADVNSLGWVTTQVYSYKSSPHITRVRTNRNTSNTKKPTKNNLHLLRVH